MQKEDNGLTRYYLNGISDKVTSEEIWIEAENEVAAAAIASDRFSLPRQARLFSRIEWFSKTGRLLTILVTDGVNLDERQALIEEVVANEARSASDKSAPRASPASSQNSDYSDGMNLNDLGNNRKMVSMRLSAAARRLLNERADLLGLSKSAAIEMLLRTAATEVKPEVERK